MIKLITSEPNIRYFSGFTGSVGIFIIKGSLRYLIIDGRYTEQAKKEVYKGIKVLEAPIGTSLLNAAIKSLKRLKPDIVGYEDDKMDCATFGKLKSALPRSRFISVSGEIRDKRNVKNGGEIENIKKAALIADLTYDCILKIIRQGLTEKEIAAQMDYLMKTFNADLNAFETLVSSGKLSAYPHGKPTDRKLAKGDMVILDFGARYKGYNSDITRMISIGSPSKRQLKFFNLVKKAHDAAIAKVRAGVKAKDIDNAARKVMTSAGSGKYFRHSTGHGIGLAVHEGPRVSMDSGDTLKEGMVITIEPGIYIPGFGGFRIENMLLVKKNGYEILTNSPSRLEII